MSRKRDAGFSLTELMVAVVIIGVLAAIATPYVGRDRQTRQGRDFASTVARDFQRCRIQAVTERLSIRAFVFSDRIEFRSAIAGATPADPPTAPTTNSPLLRVLQAPAGVNILDVKSTTAAPGNGVLTTATSKDIDFTVLGQSQLVGSPALTSAFVYVRHTGLDATNIESKFRVDVNALTGFVGLRDRWN